MRKEEKPSEGNSSLMSSSLPIFSHSLLSFFKGEEFKTLKGVTIVSFLYCNLLQHRSWREQVFNGWGKNCTKSLWSIKGSTCSQHERRKGVREETFPKTNSQKRKESIATENQFRDDDTDDLVHWNWKLHTHTVEKGVWVIPFILTMWCPGHDHYVNTNKLCV